MLIHKLISGGQTGVDRAALDVALAQKIPCGGWCPRGRKAEDGLISDHYPLQETPVESYSERTEWNVRDSDGTLILSHGKPTGGTTYTIECARRLQKPVLIFDLKKGGNQETFRKWINENKIYVLNVAGPRESHAPGKIYEKAKEVLAKLLANEALVLVDS